VNWAVNAATILVALVTAIALIREWRRDRGKPAVDAAQADQMLADKDTLRATIEKMAAETHRSRDFRIWQLEGYVDLDRSWHRKMITLVEYLIELLRAELAKNGGALPVIDVPLPPEIPEPPRV
jgi:hypothetical protein